MQYYRLAASRIDSGLKKEEETSQLNNHISWITNTGRCNFIQVSPDKDCSSNSHLEKYINIE